MPVIPISNDSLGFRQVKTCLYWHQFHLCRLIRADINGDDIIGSITVQMLFST